MERVPVQVVSGFLGAGKTTAIRAQLAARAGERVAVIVNDFGEAALDRESVSGEAPFQLIDIPGGCVCCTAPEGFVAALGAVLDAGPDRLLIEPTGLARPQDLVDTMRRCEHRDRVALQPVVVLVDPARMAGADAAEGALIDEQLEAADVVVANRTDLCSEAELASFETRMAERWPAPLVVHRTRHGEIPAALLAWPEAGPSEPRETGGGGHAHGASTEGYCARSAHWPAAAVFARERLLAALDEPALARAKGVFRTREGWLRLERAGGRCHETPTAHRRDSRVDAIVRGDATAAARVLEALERALLSEEERAQEGREIELALPGGRLHRVTREGLAALPDGVADVATLFPKRRGEAARLARLFEGLGLPLGGEAVVCAADGFASEPVALGVLAQGLLLYGVEGGALPAEQGGPFRLLIPESVTGAPSSCANVKAVARIVIREP